MNQNPPSAVTATASSRTAVYSVLIAATLFALTTAAAAQPVAPSGDAYLCYKAGLASGQEFTASQKTLEDQFGTFVADVKGVAALCNPKLTAAHPTVHLVGYKFGLAKDPAQAKFVKTDFSVSDEFGTHPLTLVKPVEVRAPSAKVLGADGTGLVDTTGIDHFECYKAKPAKGAAKFVPPEPMTITDQFGSQTYTLKKIAKVCTPVNKNGEDATAPQHPGLLVCYRAKLPAGVKFTAQTVSVNNANFGPAVLDAKSVLELCVPALEDTTEPTTSTTIPPTTTTTTTTTTTLQTSCSDAQPCPGGVPCCAGTCLADDASCVSHCSVTASIRCQNDADCRSPSCFLCSLQDPNQTCVQGNRPNYCGSTTCLRGLEQCCFGNECCTNDQTCRSDGTCQTNCGTRAPCGDICCADGLFCDAPTVTCKLACGTSACFAENQTCCFSTCCDTATQVCGPSSGNPCVARRTCNGTDVYIPTTDQCCSQQAACGGNSACCNLIAQRCDTASGACVPNP